MSFSKVQHLATVLTIDPYWVASSFVVLQLLDPEDLTPVFCLPGCFHVLIIRPQMLMRKKAYAMSPYAPTKKTSAGATREVVESLERLQRRWGRYVGASAGTSKDITGLVVDWSIAADQ